MRLFSRKKKNDKDFLKWFNKGYSLNELKRYEEAILCFEKTEGKIFDLNTSTKQKYNYTANLVVFFFSLHS